MGSRSDGFTQTPERGALADTGNNDLDAGGASQEVFPAKGDRVYFFFQNISIGDLWIDFGVAAIEDTPSIKVVPDGHFVFEDNVVDNRAINVIGATLGQKFVAKEL